MSGDGELAEIVVQLRRLRKYHAPSASHAPDLDALDNLFLGPKLSVPDLEGSVYQVRLGAFIVEGISGHR